MWVNFAAHHQRPGISGICVLSVFPAKRCQVLRQVRSTLTDIDRLAYGWIDTPPIAVRVVTETRPEIDGPLVRRQFGLNDCPRCCACPGWLRLLHCNKS